MLDANISRIATQLLLSYYMAFHGPVVANYRGQAKPRVAAINITTNFFKKHVYYDKAKWILLKQNHLGPLYQLSIAGRASTLTIQAVMIGY